MKARIRATRWECDCVTTYALEPMGAALFPAFTAGAHVRVQIQYGLSRSYSLINDPAETARYEIAVLRAADSRGGSRHIHATWRAGDVLGITEPRNNFALHEGEAPAVMIAGGIGVTPFLSMIPRLQAGLRTWELHYAVSTAARAAFAGRLAEHAQAHIYVHDDPAGQRLDIAGIVDAAPAGAHLYCCGPARMLEAFRLAAQTHPAARIHTETFSADIEAATAGGYSLVLQRAARNVQVRPGETVLDALIAAGINVGFACMEGLCGSCIVPVLEGEPDHRDHFLTPAEKQANRVVMVCCSGSRTPFLVLDL